MVAMAIMVVMVVGTKVMVYILVMVAAVVTAVVVQELASAHVVLMAAMVVPADTHLLLTGKTMMVLKVTEVVMVKPLPRWAIFMLT